MKHLKHFIKAALYILLLVLLSTGCGTKDSRVPAQPAPAMTYTHLDNAEVGFNQRCTLDLNHDGFTDFSAYTLLVGDPEAKADYHQYYFGSSYFTDFPVNNNEEVPVLNKGNTISANSFSGYNWYNASSIVLAQKVVGVNKVPYWEGTWKGASHKYLPLRIKADNKTYYGWVEVSFNTQSEKIILHNAAVCINAAVAVRAGI